MKYMNLANDSGPAFYYTDKWRRVVEDHLDLLRNAQNTTINEIAPIDAYRYRGDFFGYLTSLKIPAQYHYVVARVNGMTDGSELTEFHTTIIIPPNEAIERLRSLAQTTYGQ